MKQFNFILSLVFLMGLWAAVSCQRIEPNDSTPGFELLVDDGEQTRSMSLDHPATMYNGINYTFTFQTTNGIQVRNLNWTMTEGATLISGGGNSTSAVIRFSTGGIIGIIISGQYYSDTTWLDFENTFPVNVTYRNTTKPDTDPVLVGPDRFSETPNSFNNVPENFGWYYMEWDVDWSDYTVEWTIYGDCVFSESYFSTRPEATVWSSFPDGATVICDVRGKYNGYSYSDEKWVHIDPISTNISRIRVYADNKASSSGYILVSGNDGGTMVPVPANNDASFAVHFNRGDTDISIRIRNNWGDDIDYRSWDSSISGEYADLYVNFDAAGFNEIDYRHWADMNWNYYWSKYIP